MAEPHIITKEEYQRISSDAKNFHEKQQEWKGKHGAVVAQGVKSYGLNPQIFKMMTALSKKETTQQQETLRAILLYADHEEMFDSIDAFDPVIDQMERIVNRVRGRNGPAPADQAASDVVTNLAQPH